MWSKNITTRVSSVNRQILLKYSEKVDVLCYLTRLITPACPIFRVFKTQNVLLSESLRDKKVGAKRETLSELVVKCGGRPGNMEL